MKIQKRVLFGAIMLLFLGMGCVKTTADKGSSGPAGSSQDGPNANTAESNATGEIAPGAKAGSPSVIKAEPIVKEGIEWLKLEEAYARNQQEPRKIFVDVYTDWCGWCKKMDKVTFSDEKVAAYVNENYYAVKLNAESDREFEMAGETMSERAVARQLGVRSYPTIVFIHEDFQKFQPVPGYRAAEDFLEVLTKFRAIEIPKN
jgi:thioredoxin-related protein